ncbi:MAG: S8 family peptidase [Bacteroidales bacterium]|nr:S8 family peptidase [Bacteroidales bacterium]MBN2819906.1 S8 family peptidase [Bacteroidales bacterium]
MKKITIITTLASLLLSSFSLFAGSEDSVKYANWQNLDPKEDKTWGISTEKAYSELLAGKESKTIVVAVIDNGVDINHEDLKGHIWVNEDEIPDNGIDDDNNGYIDDVHGWNFLGNSEGENINEAPLEVTRLYKIYSDKFKDMDLDSLKKAGNTEVESYETVLREFETDVMNYTSQKARFEQIVSNYNNYDKIVAEALGKENYTYDDVKKLKFEKETQADSAQKFMKRMKKYNVTPSMFDGALEYFDSRLKYHYNPEFSARTLIGDDIADWNDNSYGNNIVDAAKPDHGTMVASIIAADRNNNIGIKGIADNVIIMPIRAVPDGDEWDKDVALAIKYAIDNGAEIVNMSFGKSFSPQKEFVDEVIKLADEKNVLLVHAAGNDNENVDIAKNFPNQYNAEGKVIINNWLTVGASAKDKKKKEFVASFSNYGKKTVDLFAPGYEILMCAPGNKYESASGTSMASPMVAGAAALVKSYYPNLTAAELKEILLESSATKDIKVLLPGTGGKNKQYVPFSSLSTTGGLLNVYKALQLAEEKSK